jgi:hypothetical protein
MPTIAIVGASPDRSKFGNKAVRAYAKMGYAVYPIHPKAGEIEGLRAYASLLDVPVAVLDRVSIYLPPDVGLRLIDEIARKPAGEVWFNPGADSPALIKKARELGINAIQGCSIVDLGLSPAEFE